MKQNHNRLRFSVHFPGRPVHKAHSHFFTQYSKWPSGDRNSLVIMYVPPRNNLAYLKFGGQQWSLRDMPPYINGVGEGETSATVGAGEKAACGRLEHYAHKTRARFSSLFAKPSCKTAKCGRSQMLAQTRLEARRCFGTQEAPRAT